MECYESDEDIFGPSQPQTNSILSQTHSGSGKEKRYLQEETKGKDSKYQLLSDDETEDKQSQMDALINEEHSGITSSCKQIGFAKNNLIEDDDDDSSMQVESQRKNTQEPGVSQNVFAKNNLIESDEDDDMVNDPISESLCKNSVGNDSKQSKVITESILESVEQETCNKTNLKLIPEITKSKIKPTTHQFSPAYKKRNNQMFETIDGILEVNQELELADTPVEVSHKSLPNSSPQLETYESVRSPTPPPSYNYPLSKNTTKTTLEKDRRVNISKDTAEGLKILESFSSKKRKMSALVADSEIDTCAANDETLVFDKKAPLHCLQAKSLVLTHAEKKVARDASTDSDVIIPDSLEKQPDERDFNDKLKNNREAETNSEMIATVKTVSEETVERNDLCDDFVNQKPNSVEKTKIEFKPTRENQLMTTKKEHSLIDSNITTQSSSIVQMSNASKISPNITSNVTNYTNNANNLTPLSSKGFRDGDARKLQVKNSGTSGNGNKMSTPVHSQVCNMINEFNYDTSNFKLIKTKCCLT